MDGAGTAQAHAAAELGAAVTRHVANSPEQRHILSDIQLVILTIEFQGNHGRARIYSWLWGRAICRVMQRTGACRSTQTNRLSDENSWVFIGSYLETKRWNKEIHR